MPSSSSHIKTLTQNPRSMSEIFPREIITEILLRLPAKSLLRFRCVSKPWCAQTDDPNFIKTHLKMSMKTNSNLGLLFADPNPDYLYWVSFDSLNPSMKKKKFCLHELDYPFKGPTSASHNIKIVGSCNGLLCFGNASGSIVLMNPLTRRHYILPHLIMDANAHVKGKSIWGAWAFGFGYDSVNDDYKVVRLGQYLGLYEDYFDTETMVYSYKSNSWRKVSGMTYVLGADQKMGVLVGDALHWLADRNRILRNPNLIVAFDLGVENFREVPGPQLISEISEQNNLLILGLVEQWLSLYAICKDASIDIWVMKDYGVNNSWTRLFSFTPNVVSYLNCMRTLVYTKNGDEVLLGLQKKNLIFYSIKEKCVKKIKTPTSATPFTVEVFRESLVPLNVNKESKVKKARLRMGRKNRDEFLSKGFKLVL